MWVSVGRGKIPLPLETKKPNQPFDWLGYIHKITYIYTQLETLKSVYWDIPV